MEETESSDRTIASRPSLEQVSCIVSFMSAHPPLALGQLRGLEGRDQSRRLWARLASTLNALKGPTRPVKSWIKYWADKKSAVRAKVQSCGGQAGALTSPSERAIWDQFLAGDTHKRGGRGRGRGRGRSARAETCFETLDVDPPPPPDDEPPHRHPDTHAHRHTQLMDTLLQTMGRQGAALSQLAQAAAAHAHAMERLADAQLTQARALGRLASTVESIGMHARDVGPAARGIHSSLERYYHHETT